MDKVRAYRYPAWTNRLQTLDTHDAVLNPTSLFPRRRAILPSHTTRPVRLVLTDDVEPKGGALVAVEASVDTAREFVLWDGRVLRLSDTHLTLFRPNRTIECSYPRDHIIECNSSPTTWDIFLRFWNKEEIALLATSGKDTDQIINWAHGAQRLRRRTNMQRAIRKRRARSRIISGGLSLAIGVTVLLLTYQVGKTTGYYLVPIGAIGFGSIRFAQGIIQYFAG